MTFAWNSSKNSASVPVLGYDLFHLVPCGYLSLHVGIYSVDLHGGGGRARSHPRPQPVRIGSLEGKMRNCCAQTSENWQYGEVGSLCTRSKANLYVQKWRKAALAQKAFLFFDDGLSISGTMQLLYAWPRVNADTPMVRKCHHYNLQHFLI